MDTTEFLCDIVSLSDCQFVSSSRLLSPATVETLVAISGTIECNEARVYAGSFLHLARMLLATLNDLIHP